MLSSGCLCQYCGKVIVTHEKPVKDNSGNIFCNKLHRKLYWDKDSSSEIARYDKGV